jgi:hypothetical protein
MANSMESTMKTYATLWLSGLIAGVIIMERWRRTGRRLIPVPDRAADADGPPTASTASTLSPDQAKVSAVLLAGAKADAVRVQHFVQRVTPWTPDPSPARLHGWSQPAATPASTPHPPA